MNANPIDTPHPASLGLYIHWPFCRKKCPYCDFNSHVREGVEVAAWQRLLLTEMAHFARMTGRRPLKSIFFGGGTPSLMPPSLVEALIDGAARHWEFDDRIEITLEANPTSSEARKFRELRAAGVNRLSVGIQALDDAALRFLGREHSAAEAKAAIGLAARHFERFSFDLIYARPGQSLPAWRAELQEALAFQPGHLSLYQLTIEEGTGFAARYARGEFALPEEEQAAQLYETTEEETEKAGLRAYEISNYAKAGAECRHNLIYWRYQDYVGIGPGAHGRISTSDGKKYATRQRRLPEAWMKEAAECGHATEECALIPPLARAEEYLLMGLRLEEGISVVALSQEAGRPWEELLDEAALSRLRDSGLVSYNGERLTASKAGRLCLNSLLPVLLRK